MNDNTKIKAIKSHLGIFKTYKELQNILPFGYIKTRISPAQKYSFKKQSILINLEKEKIKEISPTKITKNLLYNKNIYIFSEETEKTKKIITKLKKYYSFNNPKKNISLKSETNDSFIQNNSQNAKNIINFDNYIINTNPINKKNKKYYPFSLSDNEQNTNNIYENLSRNEFGLYSSNYRKSYRSSSINNYEMKSNIYLPTIIDRLKKSLPRYQRQHNGLLVNGLGRQSVKDINVNINNDIELLNKEKDNLKRFKFMKNKSGPVYLLSYDIKDNQKFERDIINKNKKYKTNLLKKNLKISGQIEIIGIKKKIK